MKIAEFKVTITGDLTDAEFDRFEPYLEQMAEVLESEAEMVFDAKTPADFARRLKMTFEQ